MLVVKVVKGRQKLVEVYRRFLNHYKPHFKKPLSMQMPTCIRYDLNYLKELCKTQNNKIPKRCLVSMKKY